MCKPYKSSFFLFFQKFGMSLFGVVVFTCYHKRKIAATPHASPEIPLGHKGDGAELARWRGQKRLSFLTLTPQTRSQVRVPAPLSGEP